MTDEQLQAIKGRFERTTPGPWGVWNGYTLVSPEAGKTYCVERIGPFWPKTDNPWYGLFGEEVICGSGPDLEFVAHAWEDIAALLKAIRELTADKPLFDDLEGYDTVLEYYQDRLD